MSALPPSSRTVQGCGAFDVETRVPGDKSISQRAAIFAGLAEGLSEVRGFLESEDARHTLAAMERLGASVERAGDRLLITGTAGQLSAPGGPLDLGNSGTGMRLLAGVLAGQPFSSTLTGDPSLSSRPMKRIQEPLLHMGADIALSGERGTAPIRISGGSLRGIHYAMPVASAQVKSCILLAGLFAEGATTVIEPAPCRDHTERALSACGLPVQVDGSAITIQGAGPAGPRFKASPWRIPGDFSSAAFWMAAAAGRPGRRVVLPGVGLNPRRTALIDVLKRMGAEISVQLEPFADGDEPVGTLVVEGAKLRATHVGGDEIPNLIDELPLVAVAGALAEGTTHIRDAAELRVKESDRIACMAIGLRNLGVEVIEQPDGMDICGGLHNQAPCEAHSFGDHRIAMALAVLALYGTTEVTLQGTQCTETSYPGFWDTLAELGEHRD